MGLFSDHKGSLLRRQPGAVLDLKDVLDLRDLCSVLIWILRSSQVVAFFAIFLP